MNKELKQELINYLHEMNTWLGDDGVDEHEYFRKWTNNLLFKIQRKRGRIKGTKYPRRSTIADELTDASSSIRSHLFSPQRTF